MTRTNNHISVCVCTYKRTELLAKLLNALKDQDTGAAAFTYSVVVVDNDHMGSAEKTVQNSIEHANVPITYHIEPEQNIALARNKAVENAKGDFIAFVDDDEVPRRTWLLTLYKVLDDSGAAGVLGPVVPSYEVDPPTWVLRGKFHERPSHRTGEVLHWTNTRTGNVLLRRATFADGQNMFRREFGSGGEDRDFFKQTMATGSRFIWCAEAPVYEAVTAARCTRSFMLRRALLRGQLPHFTTKDFALSLLAVPVYTAALPFLLLVAHHLFMKYLIKDCDHIGRIFSYCGISLIKDKYIA